MRPTKKAFALVAGALVLFSVGANIQSGWLYVVAASFLGAVAAGLLIPTSALRGVSIERWVPALARTGDEVDLHLSVTNSRANRRGAIKLTDHLLTDTDLLIETLPPKGVATFDYRIRARRRGVYEGAAVRLETGFPFGVAVARRNVWVASEMIVHPNWVTLAGFPMLEIASTPNEPLHDRRKRGGGLDFYGIREYRPGDSVRLIHWKSSAKGGRLLVREFEEQPASHLSVLIDAAETLGDDPETTFEDGVSAAASVVVYAIQAGHPAQLFCDSPRGTQQFLEPSQHEALDWLARVEPGGRRGMARVAEEMLENVEHRSTNVLVFPTTRRCRQDAPAAISVLQSLSTRVIAIALSAVSYDSLPRSESLPAAEEEQFLEEVASMRTIVYRVIKGKGIADCLKEPYLT